MILAADCVYFEPAFPLLVQTLSDLSDSRTEILFCYKKRRKVRCPSLSLSLSSCTSLMSITGRQAVLHDAQEEVQVCRGQ